MEWSLLDRNASVLPNHGTPLVVLLRTTYRVSSPDCPFGFLQTRDVDSSSGSSCIRRWASAEMAIAGAPYPEVMGLPGWLLPANPWDYLQKRAWRASDSQCADH